MASEEQENVCFCCYAEDSVFLCGCSCKTLHACGSCIWKLTSQQLGTQYWRTHGRQCKVCRQEYSDGSVLAGCNHALETVMALGCGTPERDSVQNDVLYMLIAFTDKTLAVTKALHQVRRRAALALLIEVLQVRGQAAHGLLGVHVRGLGHELPVA
jgi:hypothetical protein